MIYLDTSVVLAELLAEDVHPSESFWSGGPFITSRLLQYEVWTRLHAAGLGETHIDDTTGFLRRLTFLELAQPVLERALRPFRVPVRTLDALHLASIAFLLAQGQRPQLATYDRRQAQAAAAEGIPLSDLGGESLE